MYCSNSCIKLFYRVYRVLSPIFPALRSEEQMALPLVLRSLRLEIKGAEIVRLKTLNKKRRRGNERVFWAPVPAMGRAPCDLHYFCGVRVACPD